MSRRSVIVVGLLVVAGLVAGAFAARPRPTVNGGVATSGGLPPRTPHRGFPSPPAHAVVYARQWGGDALALGIVPVGSGPTVVQASVIGQQGVGVSGLRVLLDGRAARPCGVGCYRVTLPRAPHTVEMRIQSARWRVTLPRPWPPRDATRIVRRAQNTWRALHSLTITERLASDASHATSSVWHMQAPDRVAYQVREGWAGIIVGSKRWDRAPNAKRWTESPQAPVTQPTPAWVRIRDAHLLGVDTVGGRRVWRVSFFDPATPAWFAVAIDQTTYHTLESQMVTTAHFMHDRYSSFNRSPPVTAP